MSDKHIFTKQLWDGVTLVADDTMRSGIINLNDYNPEGYFSLQVKLTGSGTGKFTFELSNDGVDYHTPTDSSDIVTAHTVSSGPAADGKDTYIIDIDAITRYMKIKVEETASSDIIVTATIAIQ